MTIQFEYGSLNSAYHHGTDEKNFPMIQHGESADLHSIWKRHGRQEIIFTLQEHLFWSDDISRSLLLKETLYPKIRR